MKLSELIKELEQILIHRGDIPVEIYLQGLLKHVEVTTPTDKLTTFYVLLSGI